MNEKVLLIISLICIIVGIPLLYFSSKFIDNEDPRILTEVKGTIKSMHSGEKVIILNVEPSTTIPVVLFEQKDFENGQKIIAKGRLGEYKNKVEFIAEDIQIE